MRGFVFVVCSAVAGLCACGGGADFGAAGGADAARTTDPSGVVAERVEVERVERALDDALQGVFTLADSIDALFRPIPLLTPAQEAQFRRFGNAAQLARARALGVHAPSEAVRAQALRDGRLVRLEDSTRHWVVRELMHSEPLVTPDARALLERVGERFQQRLERLGVPPYRLEVTSVLRTAESQAELRRTNPNAALSESAHEYGTTIDVAYASFAAPDVVARAAAADALPWLEARLDRVAAAVLESVAARNSRELQAILGHVMIELQQEGAAMVTMERLQPVYHFTVARRLASPGPGEPAG
jgi:hypothetical protein